MTKKIKTKKADTATLITDKIECKANKQGRHLE